MKTKIKQVALLCDVPGLWWAATKFNSGRVDYMKLRTSVMLAPNQAPRELYSGAWLHDREGINKFEGALGFLGYTTKVVPRGTPIDALIAATALEVAKNFDVIAIAASSGRYQTLKASLSKLGKELEIWAFPVSCQLDEMQPIADRWCALDAGVIQLDRIAS